MSFLDTFEQKYAPHLGQRTSTFREMFLYLESLNKDFYTILETGTTRATGNFIGDGCSTVMFDEYINTKKDGIVYTVDINAAACSVARSVTSPKTSVVLGDSVKFLSNFNFPEQIDLLYLDSFDFDFNNPHPSSFHHIKELTTVYARLRSGVMIVVDDNFTDGSGKGKYVREFLDDVGDHLVSDSYQLVYRKR
jgi:predicted O-methyltransferase YrrM